MKKQNSRDSNSLIPAECRARLQKVNDINGYEVLAKDNVSIAPTAPLAEFIERFWYSSDAPPHQKVRIVPNGTMELVFNLDEDELGIYDTEQPGSYKRF